MTGAPVDVTVAIPTYRRPLQLRRALESALEQTHPPIAIVIGDDAAQDEVRELVEAYGDPRIHYHPRRPVLRMTENWDFVMRAASGGLVALLEDDNFWRPHHLEHAVEVLRRHPRAALYHCAHDEARDSGGMLHYYKHQLAPWHDELIDQRGGTVSFERVFYDALECGSINSSTVVLRREVLGEVPRFDHRYLMGMDTMMWTRIAMRAPVVYGPWADVVYTYHGGNVSTSESATRRTTVHARAARIVLLDEALAGGLVTVDSLERDLHRLPAPTAGPVIILAADRRQPSAVRQVAARVFSARQRELQAISGHLRLASTLGSWTLGYSGLVDRLLHEALRIAHGLRELATSTPRQSWTAQFARRIRRSAA